MENKEFENEFFENGFVVLKNYVPIGLLEEGKTILSRKITEQLNSKVDFRSGFLELREKDKKEQFKLQEMLFDELDYRGFLQKLLKSSKILEKLICLLGPDLSYENGQIVVNCQGEKRDYYIKKWHQEFWSGSGIHKIGLWTPLSIQKNIGGLEFIRSSHFWGHIPHRNREPVKLPKDIEIVRPLVEEGDTVIFHSLTVHRTVINENPLPRFGLPLFVKNFYYPESGISEFSKWTPFHFSQLSYIYKKLGNPAFSPFRTPGNDRSSEFII